MTVILFIFTQEAKQVAKFMDDWRTLRLATVICWLGRDSYHRNLLIPRWFVQNNMMCRSNANPMPFLHEAHPSTMTPLKALASPSEAQNQGMVHDHYPWFPKRIDGTHGVGYAIWLDANCRHMLHRLLVYGRFTGSRWVVAKWGSQFNQFR